MFARLQTDCLKSKTLCAFTVYPLLIYPSSRMCFGVKPFEIGMEWINERDSGGLLLNG
jgi:hypothetical protein